MFYFFYLIAVSQASNNTCRVSNCDTCSFKAPLLCNNCKLGYERTIDGCIKSQSPQDFLIENCFSYNSDKTCAQCKPGYTLQANSCEPDCIEECSCFEPNKCVDLWFLVSEKDSNKSNERKLYCSHCNDCDYYYDYCNSCESGYYRSYGYCYSCGSGCRYCYGYYSCYECESGYSLNDGECEKESSVTINIGIIVGPIVSTLVCCGIIL